MSRLAVVSYMSLDGMTSGGKAHDTPEWYPYDSSLDQIYIDAYRQAGAVVFGRKSFEALRAYWPTPASASEPKEMRAVNTLPKIVFSRTVSDPRWEPTRIERSLTPERIDALKAEHPDGLLVIGSGSLVSELLQMKRVDALTLIIAPTVLGGGKPYFGRPADNIGLRLQSARPYGNGNLVVHYAS